MSNGESVATHRENAKGNFIDALGWVLLSEVQELGRGSSDGIGNDDDEDNDDDGGFVLMGPRVYYFLGGTMSGKSTTIRDLLLQRNKLIAFRIAQGYTAVNR